MEHSQANRGVPYPRATFTVRTKNDRNADANKDVRAKPLDGLALRTLILTSYRNSEVDSSVLFDALVKGGYVVPAE